MSFPSSTVFKRSIAAHFLDEVFPDSICHLPVTCLSYAFKPTPFPASLVLLYFSAIDSSISVVDIFSSTSLIAFKSLSRFLSCLQNILPAMGQEEVLDPPATSAWTSSQQVWWRRNYPLDAVYKRAERHQGSTKSTAAKTGDSSANGLEQQDSNDTEALATKDTRDLVAIHLKEI